MSRSTTIKLPALHIPSPPTDVRTVKTRGRSGSLVKVEQVGDRSNEEDLDRSAYVNINADWVNAKGVHRPSFNSQPISHPCSFQGAWLIHVVLIICGKIIIDTVPGMTPQISWTLVNIFYLAVSFSLSSCARLSHHCALIVVLSHVPLGDWYPV